VTELSGYALSPLREGPFTLYRGFGEGPGSFLLVAPAGEYPSPGSVQRLEHEYALRTDLDGDWSARPVEFVRRQGRLMLMLADPGGEPLERLLGRPMQVTEFLQIAVPLAASVGRLHARGLIHKDLKPANILVDTANGKVWLTGFGIASRLPREHQAPAPPEVIAGTLAYMAPEQTGRMNRSVDARSDLYALGVTFYEMLAGALPFTAADPMEWVHCHIARQPVPPDERVAGIPGPLSAIVMKLLAKTAEDRYQTAAGLIVDLERCLADWQATGDIAPFKPGQHDMSDRLRIPERLYGRECEIQALLAAFDRVVVSGTAELVLVSGYSGIGKSSVVNELHKALVPPRGLFASGKFDQYRRDVPYATLAQAFQSLVRSLLGQSEAALGRWRDALSEALGPNGQLIVNLIPELELLIGQPPPVPELPPQDARNRFQMVFRRFLGVFARAEHPLALFLDDLQWLDSATLEFIEHLFTHSEARHLMLIGAYRDNEVGPAHPLSRTLAAIRSANVRVREIVLAPLGLDDVGRLLADALHCEPERAWPLTQLVQEKTGGNPFFVIQFFTALAEEGLLAFDPAAPGWQWDIHRIRAKGYTDNVVDLMAGKLQRFSAITQDALKQLACLGNVASTGTLALVHGTTEKALHAALWEAVHAGLVFHEEGTCRFLHDRIQQAAYSLIPEAQRADVHLRIGRVLLASMTADELAVHLFDVANQFNRAAIRLLDRDEKVQVAAINLRAGRKAKASAAYASASVYLAAGMAVLDEAEWDSEYDLMFGLRLECAECAFPSGQFDTGKKLIGELLQRGTSKVDQAAAYHLKVLLHTVQSEYPEAVASALVCLRLFGIDIPAQPGPEQVQAEYETVWQILDGSPIEGLIDLPLMTDPELLAAMQVLSTLLGPAYFTDSHLCCWLVCRMVNISRRHGTCGASAHGYAYLGCLLGPVFHRYDDGYRFVKLACDLVEKQGFIAYQAKSYHSMGIAAVWTQPPTTAIDFNRAAFRTATETGDLTSACYSLDRSITILLLRNDPLDAVWREAENSLDFVRKAGFRDVADRIICQQRLIATMQGRTTTFSTFSDAQFDAAAFEARLTPDRNAMMVCCYWIAKLKALFISGDYARALAAAEKAKPLLRALDVHIQLLDYHYYGALTVAVLYEDGSADEQSGWRDVLAAHAERLREWADTYPPTFADKYTLAAAEIARLEGRDPDAMRLYERAIQSARNSAFAQNEGLAYEVAARFYGTRGFETIAHAYLRNARDCYLRWGALGKVRHLEQLHPEILEGGSPWPPAAMVATPVGQLDIRAVVKASQAVSGEIELDRLIKTLMTIALEHAGAERALLVLLRGEALQIEAEARTDDKKIEVMLRQAPVTTAALPEAVLHTVIRTQHSVILDDAAATQNPFAADAYIRQTNARSVLCLPLVEQAKLIGALYLENNLASHVFTPARISVLELLASQAAISLENARLYTDLQVSEERWRNLFESVPVGVTLTGPDGRYVAANQTFLEMTGYSEAELCRLSPVELTHEDDRAGTVAILAARDAGNPYPLHVEKRYRRKDGSVVWVDGSAFVAPVVAGAPLFAAAVIDITDRKRAEEELRRSEASLAQAQQISHTGSWRWNIGTGEVRWSTEHFRIFGLDPQTARPSFASFKDRICPEDRPSFEQALGQAVRERNRFQSEYRIALPDGSVKYLQSVGQPDSTESGELEFVGTVMDITERRRAEEALRNAQAELARVARLTTMGELVASISHEVNQPLAAVATNADACLRWLNREDPDLDEARDAASRVVRDAQRAADVIRSLRALAKKSGPQLTRLDIHDVIEEVLALTRGELQQHGVVLLTDLTAGDRPVLGDKVQLQQVLLNLIMNGIQAMGSVTDRSRELTVSVAVAAPDRVQVAVADTGPGLDPATAQCIFEPFFTTKPDGLGMGLSICRSIVEAHGGRLWISPRAPHGTALHFTIPIAGEMSGFDR
jgi:PAS domain S-box-containing protein